MKNGITYFYFILFSFSFVIVQSQNEAQKWIFGSNVFLDFVSNPPTNLSSPSYSFIGNGPSSISDANGNLLFYTNGNTVWTKTYTVMSNGTGLLGQGFQNSIILPRPGSNTLYYIFTLRATGTNTPNTDGLHYSIVDMSLAGGQGSVTVKNALLYQGSVCQKLTGTKNCNGSDYWVSIKTMTSSNTCQWNGVYSFLSFNLNTSGVSTIAAVSTFTYANGNEYSQAVKVGQMKISPNGKKLACANYAFCWPYNSNVGSFEIYDFDNSTGLVTNFVPLYTSPSPVPSSTLASNASGWGIAFSSDASKLFGTLCNNYYYPYGSLLQWDLCSANNNSIAVTQVSLAAPTISPSNGFTSLQLAPNGKIYSAHYSWGNNSLSVINSPNLYGAATGFSLAVQSITPGTSNFELPNFIGSQFFLRGSIPAYSTSVVNSTLGCQVLQFQSPLLIGGVTGNCPANTYTLQSLQWNFGDAASGSANTSTLSNPTHTFSSIGTFTVRLTLDFGCGGGQSTLSHTVYISNPIIGNLNFSPSLACNGINTGTAAYTGSLSANLNYLWSSGSNTYTSASVNNLSAGTWTSSVTNSLSGCSINTVFVIQQPPALTVSVPSSTVCQNSTINISVTGGTSPYTYTWSNGSSASLAVCNQTGVNTVTVSDFNACLNSLSFSVLPAPTISVTPASICVGQSVTLQASGANTYTWSGGATVSPIISTTYTVVGGVNGCFANQFITVTVNPLPNIAVTNTTFTMCSASSKTLIATGANSYTWLPSISNSSQLIISPSNTETYTLSGTSSLGCENKIQLTVTVTPTPTLQSIPFYFSCGGSTTLSASGANAYIWMPGNYTGSIVVVNPTITSIYTLTGANANCISSALITVSLAMAPSLSITASALKICAGTCLNFSNSSNFSSFNYNWGDSSLINNEIFSHCYINPGNYEVTASATYSNGCLTNSTNTLNIEVMLSPKISQFINAVPNPTVNKSFDINFNLSDADKYFLDFGDGSPIYSGVSKYSIAHTFTSIGTFCCKLFAENSITGCKDSIKQCVEVICEEDLEIPNIFTPNGDGVNEQFSFNTVCMKNFQCFIFNAWGHIIFKWSDKTGFWDGKTDQNRPCSDGVYFYGIDYMDFGNKQHKKTGTIQLMR